jgi:uncharacterized protein involved in exopolysaccharide biosynthesis
MADTLAAPLQRPDAEFILGAFRAWRRAAAAAALVMLATIALALAIAPKFVATSSLLMLLGPEYTARIDAGQSSMTTAALDPEEVVKSELEILGGPALHAAVMRRIGLDRLYPDALRPPGPIGRALAEVADAVRDFCERLGVPVAPRPPDDPVQLSLRRFERHLDLLALKDGNVIEISFRHEDPAVAADTVNALIALYLLRRTSIYSDAQSHIVAERVQAVLADAAAADAALARFKTAHGISDFAAQRELLLRRRDDAARADAAATAQIAGLDQRLAAIAAQLAALPDAIEFYHDTDMAGRIANLKATVEALRAKQSELLTNYQPDSRPALDLAQAIAEQSAALAGLQRDRSATSDRIGRNPARDTIDLDRQHAEADRAAAAGARDAAAAEQARLDAQLHALDASEPELLILTRRQAVLEDDFRALSHLMQDRRMVEEAQARAAASVRVIEPALPPVQPTPLRLLILLGGGFLALVAGAGVVIVSEAARRTFLSPARLERQLQLPVLASVPDLQAKPRPGR